MIGGFFDRYHRDWAAEEIAWFEMLLDEDDVDILGWALRTLAVPPEHAGAWMERLQRLDYVELPG